MLMFITIIFTLLFTCLSSPSFWWNIIKHHRWYDDETERGTKSTQKFVFFQFFRVIILITFAIFFKHFEYFYLFESSSLFFYLLICGFAMGFFSIYLINNHPRLRLTNKIKNITVDCLIKILVWVILCTICSLDICNFKKVETPTTLVQKTDLNSKITLDENILEVLLNDTSETYYSNNSILCKSNSDSTIIILNSKVLLKKVKSINRPINSRYIGLVIDDFGDIYTAYAHLNKKKFLDNYYIDQYILYNITENSTDTVEYYTKFPDWAN